MITPGKRVAINMHFTDLCHISEHQFSGNLSGSHACVCCALSLTQRSIKQMFSCKYLT